MTKTTEPPKAFDKSKYYKHPKFKNVYGQPIKTPIGDFGWLHIIKPREGKPPEEGKPKPLDRYEANLLLDKSSDKLTKFMAELETMTDEMLIVFNEGRSAKLGGISLFQDGDSLDTEKYPFVKNRWILQGRKTEYQPTLRDFHLKGPDKEDITPEYIKSGMQGRLVVTPLLTPSGISYQLNVLQVTGDSGKRFGREGDILGLLNDDDEYVTADEAADAALGKDGKLEEPTTESNKKGVKKAVDLL